jgi:protein phosphatase 1L
LFTGETDFACNIHHGMQGNAAEFGVPYYAVFDGHGGNACADWLSNNFVKYLAKQWQGGAPPEAAVTQAFLAADKKILAPKSGFFGAMGERGIGGSKCGATAAVALLYQNAAGKDTLLAANAGDARIVLARGKKAVQLTEDHVPDSEEERIRIEAQNPNPNMPLVRYVGGTWRVGGLLALSRAFGDAYLKGTGQFEGIQAGGDGYRCES